MKKAWIILCLSIFVFIGCAPIILTYDSKSESGELIDITGDWTGIADLDKETYSRTGYFPSNGDVALTQDQINQEQLSLQLNIFRGLKDKELIGKIVQVHKLKPVDSYKYENNDVKVYGSLKKTILEYSNVTESGRTFEKTRIEGEFSNNKFKGFLYYEIKGIIYVADLSGNILSIDNYRRFQTYSITFSRKN